MENTMEQETNLTAESEFSSKNMLSLFWKYSLFALLGLSCQCIQVVADGFIIGNGIGTLAIAVVGVTSVLWQFGIGVGALLSAGGSTLAAIKLGSGDREGARDVYGSVVIFTLILSVVISIIAYIFLDPLLVSLGATPDLMGGGRSYLIGFFIGFPFFIVGSVAYAFARLAERPLAASLVYVIPAFLAIFVEYFLVFKMGYGVGASSVAGIVCTSFCVLLIPYLQIKDTPFKLKMSDFKINFKYIFESCKIGVVMFILPFSLMLTNIVINNHIIATGGTELHLAAFGILGGYIVYILSIFTNAFISGIQPIASYNYGAKLYQRVVSVIKIGVVQSSMAIAVCVIAVYLFAKPIIVFFAGPDPELLETTTIILQIYLLLNAFGNVSAVATGYFLAVERNWMAIINGVTKMIVFAIPLILILPKFFGLKGIWMSQPIADGLSFILALVCLVSEVKRLKKLGLENVE